MERSGSRRARQTNATAAAETYAPKPNGSAVTYGLVAASLLLVVVLLAGGFVGFDVVSNGWVLAGLAVLAFVGGAMLRFRRQNEHSRAVAREFERRTPQTPRTGAGPGIPDPALAAPEAAEAPPGVAETVTFTSPFTLPGLDRQHPPGSYRVWERREPLDVSWDAFVVTRTIMLTSGGTVEALPVKAEDLAAALDRDRKASL